MLATFTVSNPGDAVVNTPAAAGTLRQAIFEANQLDDADTINFAPSLNGATITLTEGELSITKSVTIDASMLPAGLTIDASGNDDTPLSGEDTEPDDFNGSRIFQIDALSDAVSLKNLTLTGGDAAGDGGAINYLSSDLTLEDCRVEDNRTAARGGAISLTAGSLALTRSEIADNFAREPGGGIFLYDSIAMTMVESAVVRNETGTDGGGIHATFFSQQIVQSITIIDSVVSENKALNTAFGGGGGKSGSGGGILADMQGGPEVRPTLTIVNTTLDGNSAAANGGGAWVCTKYGATFESIRSTFSNNEAGSTPDEGDPTGLGGGLWLGVAAAEIADLGRLTVNLTNTTVSGNTAHKQGGGVWIGHAMPGGGLGFGGVTTDFQFVTVTNNKSPDGGGLFSEVDAPARRILTTLNSTIVSENTLLSSSTANNVAGHIEDDSRFNLLGAPFSNLPSTAAPLFNIHSDAPALAVLTDNGGPTQTHRPILTNLVTSPAIDRGDPSVVYDPMEFDQRGPNFVRVFNHEGITLSDRGPVDIGAYEISLPKVVDVRLDNPGWAREAFSYAELVAQGRQLRPIPVNNATQIQIQFSEHVMKQTPGGTRTEIGSADGNSLMTLTRTKRNSNGSATTEDSSTTPAFAASSFSYDPILLVATWTYSALVDGKYAIHLTTGGSPQFIVDSQGNALDGDWENDVATPDNLSDQPARPFLVGEGNPGSLGNEFRFHFAILGADFTGNGAVEGDDFIIWENHYGEMNQTLGDANGDLVVNNADHAIWVAARSLPLWGVNSPDLLDDELVNDIEYQSWVLGWGATGQGDMDGDGDTDNFDFLVWQASFGAGAWYIEGTMAEATVQPASDDPVGDLTLPQVMNVIISGSQSMHAPFAMNTVDGSGAQLRTVPVGGADTISITFSEAVNVSAGSLMLVSLHLTFRPDLADFYYDALSYTATWRFEGWPLADQYLLSLTDKVTDAYGNPLDGEWVNPWNNWSANAAISEFPSGDGTPGGMFNFVMTLLPGDANLDGWVDSSDYMIWQNHYAQDGGWVEGDFNGDGVVGSEDQAIFNQTYGLNYQAIWVGCDLDGDLDVDDADLDVIFDNAGMQNPTFQDGDFNFDGEIDEADLDIALAQYMLHGSCGLFIDAVW